MTAIDVEGLSARRDLQGRPMRGIRKEIYRQTRQFCEDFEEKHLNPAIDSFLKEFNHRLNIQGNDGEPAPAGVTINSFYFLQASARQKPVSKRLAHFSSFLFS